MRYLVVAGEGPGFMSEEEALGVLESVVMPTFERLIELEERGVIVAGGLPVASRSFVFVVEAESNDELDRILRDLPLWGGVQWEVTPLQSLKARAATERAVVEGAK